jgi:hypothetical protein
LKCSQPDSDEEEECSIELDEFESIEQSESVDYVAMMKVLKFTDTVTEFHTEVNHILTILENENRDNLEKFCMVEKRNILKLFVDLPGKENTQQYHSAFYMGAKKLQTSKQFQAQCKDILFQCQNMSQEQQHVSFSIFEFIRKSIISEKEDKIENTEESSNKRSFDDELSGTQMGKVRYVGAYSLGKNRYRLIVKMRSLVNSTDREKRLPLDTIRRKLVYIDFITRSQAQILSESKQTETLQETERKQNLRASLTHITDECCDFFKHVCQQTMQLQTLKNVIEKSTDALNFVTFEITSNQSLQQKWLNLFTNCDEEHGPILEELFHDVVTLFVAPLNDQYRKDYLEQVGKPTLTAHRKQIAIKEKRNVQSLLSVMPVQTPRRTNVIHILHLSSVQTRKISP